jgi:PAS domain S-box-containing protein
VWIYDTTTLTFLDVNDAAIQHYGYSHAEFLNMTVDDVLLKIEETSFEELLNLTQESKAFNNKIFRHLKKNGDIIEVEIQTNRLDIQDISGELVIIHDISHILSAERELEASKEKLLKSEKRFKALVQEGSDLTGILDRTGNYQFVSENYKAVLGYAPSQMLGTNALDYIHSEDQERMQKLVASVGHVRQVHVEPFRFRNAQNEWRWITTTATNLLDEPSVMGIVINSKDITASVNQSNELKLSNERYKLILKASDEAFCHWDIENDVVDWGSGFSDIFGYDLTTYSNTLLSDNIHEEDKDRVMNEVWEAIEDPCKEIYYSEYRYYKANREVIYIQHRGIFLRDKKGKAIRSVDTLKDITSHISRIERIEKQNQLLRQIAWTQSHDVRGPLARIIALAELLQSEDDSPDCKRQLLTYLSVSASELDQAIKDIIKKTE